MNRGWILVVSSAGLLAACDSASSLGPAPAPGSPPSVSLSIGFDEPPLAGFLRLEPPTSHVNWEYSVDLNEDGAWDYQGRLERALGYAYRFETAGVHEIRVRLEGQGGVVEHALPVVVNDPSAISIVATGQAPVIDWLYSTFEGIASSRDGESLYVGDFSGGAIFRLDAGDLTVRDTLHLSRGVEGLSISPSGAYLFAASKSPLPAYRYALPELEIASPPGDWSHQVFFVHAIDDEQALFSGLGATIRDLPGDAIVRELRTPGRELFSAGPMSVSPDGTLVAIVDRGTYSLLRLFSFPGAFHLRDLTLPDEDVWIEAVAFGPTGEDLFVSGGLALYVVDVSTGETIRKWGLGHSSICSTFCVANPTALSRDGRYLAIEQSEGVQFVDTERRMPFYRLDGASSVATDWSHPAGFFLLNSGGHIRKVRIDP